MPLHRVSGGQELLSRLSSNGLLTPFGIAAPGGPYELGFPEPGDTEEIVELIHVAFDRLFKDKRLPEDGPMAFVAFPVNLATNRTQKQEIAQGLKFRLEFGMQFPSLQRPVRQDNSVALLVRARGAGGRGSKGPILAYVELCMLPADGRRPEDDSLPVEGGAVPEAYLSNLVTALAVRRKGLGRALLSVAEELLRCAWQSDKCYLHIDTYKPSRQLYTSQGYVQVGEPFADGVTHMVRELEVEEDFWTRQEVEEEEEEDEEEEEEAEAESAAESREADEGEEDAEGEEDYRAAQH